MPTDLEDELRALLTDAAAKVTAPADLALQVRRRARRQRRNTAVLATSAAAAAGLLVVGAWSVRAPDHPRDSERSLASSPGAPTAANSGPGGSRGSTSCVQQYSPQALTEAQFALDGTVVAMGPSATYDFERRVTVQVHHWYAGKAALNAPGSAQLDSSGDLLIDMPAPDDAAARSSEGLQYAVGARLLVSGAIRDGTHGLVGPVAWGCGFTTAYEPTTAQAWEQVLTPAG